YGSSDDPRPALGVPEQRDGDGRLPRARLADQPDDLALRRRERDPVDDLAAAAHDLDPQIAYLDHSPTLATAREMPSVTKFVPIANSAMHAAGTTTAHGWIVSPVRFSLIIRPQSAFGCWIPNPRKLTAATSAIDQVSRRPYSTISGVVTLGRISRNRISRRGSAIASADSTYSRWAMSAVTPRITRATCGTHASATMRTISHSLLPRIETKSRMSTICGKARITSIPRISTSSRRERE